MTLEILKRHEFGEGRMYTNYEVCELIRITPIGVKIYGEPLFKGKKCECNKFIETQSFN